MPPAQQLACLCHGEFCNTSPPQLQNQLVVDFIMHTSSAVSAQGPGEAACSSPIAFQTGQLPAPTAKGSIIPVLLAAYAADTCFRDSQLWRHGNENSLCSAGFAGHAVAMLPNVGCPPFRAASDGFILLRVVSGSFQATFPTPSGAP